jgi:DnaJ-class molecular chaperone
MLHQTQVENQKVHIAISVEPHEYTPPPSISTVFRIVLMWCTRYFARDGHDLHLSVPLTMYEAVMGTDLTVPTLKGEKDVKVAKGTQPKSQQVARLTLVSSFVISCLTHQTARC